MAKNRKRKVTAKRNYKDTVFRINEGHNQELMEQCQILKEYAQYVAKVRTYNQNISLDAAVELAVNDCIQENILSIISELANNYHLPPEKAELYFNQFSGK